MNDGVIFHAAQCTLLPMEWSNAKFFTIHHHDVPLPPGHRFPMGKYTLLYEKLLAEKIISTQQVHPGPQADFKDGTLPAQELRPIGLPWSPGMFQRSLCSVGGFIAATENAISDGFSALLAGGTHHAHRDRGEGYCVFNDFAVAALKLLSNNRLKKILIIDLDVHQGNGNSSILGKREDVFILSLHGEKNYPFRKVKSHLDVALPEGTGDELYLSELERVLKLLPDADMIFYQGGVDVLKEDKLGTFSMTYEGIKTRDRMVFEYARKRNLPLAMAIGGGYSQPIDYSIEAYANTFRVARQTFQ
jgi:acetoin utilization deacetylase AcuC-like enzyme